jgi:hypothetical protein
VIVILLKAIVNKVGILSLRQRIIVMLQRIQTVYLLLASGCAFSVFFFDIAQFTDGAERLNSLDLYRLRMASNEVQRVSHSLFPMIALSLTVALQLVAIFSYRKRKQQMKLVRFSYLTLALSVAAVWFFVDRNYWILALSEPDLTYRAGFFMPFCSFAFAWLANRSIRNDEALVRSLDRIR